MNPNNSPSNLFGGPGQQVSGDSIAEKRETFMVDIRKQERSNVLNRKRFIQQLDNQVADKTGDVYYHLRSDPQGEIIINALESVLKDGQTRLENLETYCQMIRRGSRLEILEGLTRMRILLSIEKDTPIQAVVDTNIVLDLIKIVKDKTEEHARIEATWCLTNIATGTNLQVQSLVEKGMISLYVDTLNEDNIYLLEQVVWGIGNIAGDCIAFRNELLDKGAMAAMVKCYRKIKAGGQTKHIKNLIWAASNLCRLRPPPEIRQIASGFDIFGEAFIDVCRSSTNFQIGLNLLIDCAWALVAIINMETIEKVAQSELLPYVVQCLSVKNMILLHPCLRIIGVYSNANDLICQKLIDCDGHKAVAQLLNHEKVIIRKEAAWIISNITAGTPDQIASILNDPYIITKLFMMARTETEEVKREAVWALCNSVKNATPSQFKRLIDEGFLDLSKELLSSNKDSKVLNVILEALYEFLVQGNENFKNAAGENSILKILEENGTADLIEQLQTHEVESVYRKALRLLDSFWESEDTF